MTRRRSRGDGGLRWSESRQRWIAEVTVGYTPDGRRIVRTASDPKKGKALEKLQEKIRDKKDGIPSQDARLTVKHAVENWLEHGVNGRDPDTVSKLATLAKKHVIPQLGRRKLRELTADEVDVWLKDRAAHVSTRTLREIRSVLKRAIGRAQARDQVSRNVVLLCELPRGLDGRESKALTTDQARALLQAAQKARPWLRVYIALSLLTGVRTEELRELAWSHVVAYDTAVGRWVPVGDTGWTHEAYAVYVWRSVRKTGDTKTRKSRRTLKLPQRCAAELMSLWKSTPAPRRAGYVFATQAGGKLDARYVRRRFKIVARWAGLSPSDWTPRELRHSFVSLLSAEGVPLEDISRLVGHAGTAVTETVYRKEIRPVMQEGAMVMDRVFPLVEEA